MYVLSKRQVLLTLKYYVTYHYHPPTFPKTKYKPEPKISVKIKY